MRLSWSDRAGEPGSFIARQDGPVVLIVAETLREDETLILPCWVVVPGRVAPEYDRPVFELHRLHAECAFVYDVPLRYGVVARLLLVEWPETLLSHHYRLAAWEIRNGR